MASLSKRVAANDDDAYYVTGLGCYTGTGYLIFGDYGSYDYKAYFRWKPGIPKGSTILTANIRLTCYQSDSYSFTTNINLCTVAGAGTNCTTSDTPSSTYT